VLDIIYSWVCGHWRRKTLRGSGLQYVKEETGLPAKTVFSLEVCALLHARRAGFVLKLRKVGNASLSLEDISGVHLYAFTRLMVKVFHGCPRHVAIVSRELYSRNVAMNESHFERGESDAGLQVHIAAFIFAGAHILLAVCTHHVFLPHEDTMLLVMLQERREAFGGGHLMEA